MFVDWQLFRRRALGMSLVALALVFAVWNIPQLEIVLYPFRLFVTFVHEAGHGLAAVATGGDFIRFEVMSNGAGLATTRGGLRSVILPAGYLGAAFFGAGLFYIVNRIPYPRVIAILLGVGLVALSLLYGQTSQIALTVGTAFGAALIGMGLIASRYLIVLVINVLAIMTALNAVLDLLFLTRNTTARTPDGRVLNDAAAFSMEIIPQTTPALWAWTWASLSLLLLLFVIYRSLLVPLIQRVKSAAGRRTPVTEIAAPQVYIEDTLADHDYPYNYQHIEQEDYYS